MALRKTFEYFVKHDSNGSLAHFVLRQDNHLFEYLLITTLEKMPHVIDCGSCQPHPREPSNMIRVQTDGSMTAVNAFKTALDTILKNIREIQNQFKTLMDATKENDTAQKTDDENDDSADK